MVQPTHLTAKKQFNGRNMNNETTIQKKEYLHHISNIYNLKQTRITTLLHVYIYRPATFFITTKS